MTISNQHIIDGAVCYEGSPLILETDINNKIVYANRTFLRISGYTLGEIIGRSPEIFAHIDTPKNFYIKLNDTIRSGMPWRGSIKNTFKHSSYWTELHIQPVFHDSRICSGYLYSKKPASPDVVEKEFLHYKTRH